MTFIVLDARRGPAPGPGNQAFSNTKCPPSASTRTVSPLPNSPARIFDASGFSSCCWIARLSGREPSTGSKPTLTSTIGRDNIYTPVTNAQLVLLLHLENKKD